MKAPILERIASWQKDHPYTDYHLLLEDCAKEIKRLRALIKKHAPHVPAPERDDGGDGGTVDPPADPPPTDPGSGGSIPGEPPIDQGGA